MTVAKPSLWLLVAALAAGCGRGAGDGTVVGIDGTGAPVLAAQGTLSYGTVTALGSVVVNDVRYETSSSTVVIDGRLATEADIRVGDVVLVSAAATPSNSSSPVAAKVTIDDAVEGPIASIDVATSTFVTLGQTVRVTPATHFDSTSIPASFAGLALGDVVEVAGMRASDGDVIATRIEKKPPGGEFETTGAVVDLDVAARRFRIAALEVEYGSLAAPPDLRQGDVVEVKGSTLSPGGVLAASAVVRTSAVEGSAGDRVDITGYVTRFDASNPRSFFVAGVPVRLMDTTVTDVAVALDVKLTVSGVLDSSGTIVATSVRGAALDWPPTAIGPFTIFGQVIASTGPVAGIPVNVFVETRGFGYSYTWMHGQLYTNEQGAFTALNLPEAGEITIYAGFREWVQPCAAIPRVPNSSLQQVELLKAAAFDNVQSGPRPQQVRGATVTGTVFETIDGVRQPIGGAGIWAYGVVGLLEIASTKTDLQGQFLMCNLPAHTQITVSKDGYLEGSVTLTDSSTDPVEIELRRR